MRKLFIIVVPLLVIIFSSWFYFNSPHHEDFSIQSPLPELLTKVFPRASGDTRNWKPDITRLYSSGAVKKPILSARAAATYDLTENKLLYSKNLQARYPMASLTKIMTAIVALENLELDQKMTVDKIAANIGEGTMGLSENENLTLRDVLYGLLLQSGNDAGETIARNSKFGRDNFVYLMNKKAEELGLTNTHFTNPTGLEGDGKQYSSAYDLIVMTEYALRNPIFADIVSTYEHEIPESSTNKYFHLFNETNLLTTYPGVKGVKTGYTDEAGMCLVSYLDYDGHRIIGVVLNAENRREEMKELLDYSLQNLGIEPPPHT